MTGGFTVTPQQLLGLEVNPRAAAIADVVLWIGYLQWHFRTHGHAKRLSNPILREYRNIKQQDAVLSYSERKPRLDSNGQPVTRWDGRSTKLHPVTGQEIPDETARTIVYDYLNPKPAEWPEADYIIGNPPFIGPARMRDALGDGYTEALRKAYKGAVPESADFVMFWWHKAAELVRIDKADRFGFITTNSIKQTFNRRVIETHMHANPPLSIILAIPDHPWVDSADGAAVEIAMCVAEKGDISGRILTVINEGKTNGIEIQVAFDETDGKIQPDLTIGAAVSSVKELKANSDLSNRGFCLFGAGFIISPVEATELGLGSIPDTEKIISEYRNGRDLANTPRGVMVIDLFGFSSNEARSKFPQVYQHVLENVKPERDQNKRASRKDNWWIFGEPNPKLRKMLKG
jgi:hypothetical protein